MNDSFVGNEEKGSAVISVLNALDTDCGSICLESLNEKYMTGADIYLHVGRFVGPTKGP